MVMESTIAKKYEVFFLNQKWARTFGCSVMRYPPSVGFADRSVLTT